MPSRHCAGLRIIAVAVLVAYAVPALLPGLSGLSHEAFHAVAEPVAAEPAGQHSHHHPHSHDGEPDHTHADLVDTLLAAPLADDVIEVAHVPAPENAGPGVHLPEIVAGVEILTAGGSARLPGIARGPAGFASVPPTPPPRA
jgi:hypothetical protein